MNDKKTFPAVEKMFETDNFSKWLGITIIETKAGYSKIKMTVRKEMLNGFKMNLKAEAETKILFIQDY